MRKFLEIIGVNKAASKPGTERQKSYEAHEGDGLSQNLEEVRDFGQLLAAMEDCGQALLDALAKLQTAPSPLLDSLSQSYSQESAGGELLRSLAKQLNASVYHTTLGVPHLEEMMQRIKEVRPQIETTEQVYEKREAAWAIKVRCDRDAEAMKKNKFSIDEKRARLKAKYDADEEYTKLQELVWKHCNEILYRRWDNTAAALTNLCHCYAAIFEAPPKLADDLLKTAARLSCKHMDAPPLQSAGQESNEDWDNAIENESDYLPPPDTTKIGGATQCKSKLEVPPAATRGGPPLPSTKSSVPPSPSTSGGALLVPPSAKGGAPPLPSAKSNAPPLSSTKSGAPPVPSKSLGDAPPLQSTASGGPPKDSVNASPEHSSTIEGTPPNPITPSDVPTGTTTTQKTEQPFVPESPYKKGERVQVWSSSQNAWLEGIVKEVFATETTHDNYAVPSGVVKVESRAGIKFIQPDQLHTLLRKTISRSDTQGTRDTLGTPRLPTSTGQL